MTRKVLHFTIGPVQDFIADARRLRDFWAGSFLLSVLAGHAMAAAKNAGAEIVFPKVEGDALFEALTAGNANANTHIGSLPNRFKASISEDADAKDVALTCVEATGLAWQTLCDTIWEKYVRAAAEQHHGKTGEDNPTRKIWTRQTRNFWDMAWVAGDDSGPNQDGKWLDIRKNWRSLKPDVLEEGDHCRLMGQYQELSGYGRFPRTERNKQTAFWKAVRETGTISDLDLPEGEYLCALALIKRLFPVLLETNTGGLPGLISWKPGGTKLNIRHWPSTSYVAALPWLRSIADNPAAKSAAATYATLVNNKYSGALGETDTKLYGLPSEPFFKMDGQLLHESGAIAFVKERAEDTKTNVAKAALKELTGGLAGLADGLEKAGLPKKPSAFYAVLQMDGDNIGRLLGEHSQLVKEGLALFTQKVQALFDPANGNPLMGALVYAGGDDVLAMLPVDTAIAAACAIRDDYTAAFRQAGASEQELKEFTLSGAIVYSRFNSPLTQVLRQAGNTLDKIAKDKNGRNSLALCIMKPGGVAAEWVDVFDTSDNGGPKTLERLARDGFSKNKADATVSGGFFHGLRDHYLDLFAPRIATAEAVESDAAKSFEADMLGDPSLLTALIKADLKRQFGSKTFDEAALEMTTGDALKILRPNCRDKNGDIRHQLGIAFDGGLVVRFLAAEQRRSLKTENGPKND